MKPGCISELVNKSFEGIKVLKTKDKRDISPWRLGLITNSTRCDYMENRSLYDLNLYRMNKRRSIPKLRIPRKLDTITKYSHAKSEKRFTLKHKNHKF